MPRHKHRIGDEPFTRKGETPEETVQQMGRYTARQQRTQMILAGGWEKTPQQINAGQAKEVQKKAPGFGKP